ncbi:type IV pilus modification protein PilV [Pseudomonas tohonis]|uniref:type IV pilus modification protein PilV n=1 Tax=Pseudomonas tohonis TaxID=2725477 RepID=UPI001F3BB243|nr:type IV pilus modification protein PilV [Pseudomonas tohonis]
MNKYFSRTQRGVSLIEVMIAVFIMAVGLLGAAAMQLSALKYTDSARYRTQASFIAYDIADRIRANADASNISEYALSNASASNACSGVCASDIRDFKANLNSLPGSDGYIRVAGTKVTVGVSWSESRAGGKDASGNASTSSISVVTHVAVATVPGGEG